MGDMTRAGKRPLHDCLRQVERGARATARPLHSGRQAGWQGSMRHLTFRTICASVFVIALPCSAVAQSSPGQSLGTESVPNLRDVGGNVARDGATVRLKVLYRADQLNPIGPEDSSRMAQLRLKTSFNLRRAEGRNARPDQLPPAVSHV